ncbi:von Willebrand factor D and EGF domain-containing protein, partial [Eudyptes chrysocome]
KLTSLALQPVITPELVQGRVHLKCTFSRPSSKVPLQYMVVWSRLSTPGKKEQIQRDTTLQSFSYVEMNGVNLKLGDTVMPPCLQHKRSNAQGDQVLFLNLCCFLPESLQIAEDGKEHVLTVLSTVPIACPGHIDSCKITLQLSTEDLGKNSQLLGPPNIALSACQVDLLRAPCSESSCAAAALTVTAVTDFAQDGNRISRIRAEPVGWRDLLWRAYTPKDVKEYQQTAVTGGCSGSLNLLFCLLLFRRYNNYKIGTFLLCRSMSRAFEVHVRQWDCGGHRSATACNCGVAAR